MDLLLVYLVLINALCLLLMLADKKKSVAGRWRIPERVLLCTAALGGSLGALLGMYLLRHKIRHAAFSLGLPAMVAVQGLVLYLLLRI